jgi:hypothetical protein
MIDWLKRLRRDDTEIAERRVWESRCRRYKIEESRIQYGKGVDKRGVPLGYPPIFRIMVKRPDGWRLLSAYRKRAVAKKQIEYFAEHGTLIPKKKKKRRRKKAKRNANK